MPPLLLILGAGYVGSALKAELPDAIVTHRPGKPLAPGEHPFLLEEPDTWGALPTPGADVVWTFPARPLDLVQKFHREKLGEARSVLVLGSTSAYLTRSPDETVSESTPLDLTQERVAGEEWLREQGAMVLQLAGIFGPNRHPLQWLRKGLIKNGRKRVNLIHVDDIVLAIQALVKTPQPGVRINLANGLAPRWNELVEQFKRQGELPPDFSLAQTESGGDSKFVANERLRALLPGHPLLHP
jgi:nucleoside-diphosphate-sugar epimerase